MTSLSTFQSGIALDFTNKVDNSNKQIVQINKASAQLLNVLYGNASDYQSGINIITIHYPRNTYQDLPKDNSATSTTLNNIHGDLDADIQNAEDKINDIGNSLETRFSDKQL